MAAWKGGSWGQPGMDRAQFRAWLRTQQKAAFVSFLTVHNTGAPYTLAGIGGPKRMKALENYYKNEKRWSGGPPLFVMSDGLAYPGSPIHLQSVHSPSWNKISIGIEAEGDFDGTHDPQRGSGAVVWDTMAWVFAELLEWYGFQATDKYIRLHREDRATNHACPGHLVTKPWFVAKVAAAMSAQSQAPEPIKTPPDVMPIQTAKPKLRVMQPGSFRYSDEWAIPMMKKVEGLRLVAYPDPPGWSIGYGHNSTSGLAPIPRQGTKLGSEADAEALLRMNLTEWCRYLNTWVKVPLDQGHVDALCMLIHQQGPTQFRKIFLTDINNKMHWTTARKIENLKHAKPGVMRRRQLEAKRYRGEAPTTW